MRSLLRDDVPGGPQQGEGVGKRRGHDFEMGGCLVPFPSLKGEKGTEQVGGY